MTKDRKVQVPQNTNTPAAPVAASSKAAAAAPTSNQPAAGREKAGKNKEDKKKKNGQYTLVTHRWLWLWHLAKNKAYGSYGSYSYNKSNIRYGNKA
jgi:hypothetical protein